ncbi:MAG: hypothetical protein IPK07_15550 [Deltaproteobacteria bacterium]|nr:hypothetical protein [Deltaproteobacteria bacterium]
MKAAAAVGAAVLMAGGCAATRTAPSTSPAADGTPAALAEAAPSAVIPPAGPAASEAAHPAAGDAKIAAPIAEAVSKLTADAASSGTGKPHGATLYSTPFVKVDAAGRLHAYVHVTSLGDDERAALAAAGATIEVAMERLKIVQAWLPYDRVAAVAALPFVARISPPSYATPR